MAPKSVIAWPPAVSPGASPAGPPKLDTIGGAYASVVGSTLDGAPPTMTCQKWFAPAPGAVAHDLFHVGVAQLRGIDA